MFRASLILVIGSLAAKVLGIVRESLFAYWFGTADVAVAFRLAMLAFLLPYNALIGDTLGGAAVPLHRRMAAEGTGDEHALAAVAIGLGTLVGVTSAVLVAIFANPIVALLAPGASASVRGLAAGLLRVMTVALPFVIVSQTLAYLAAVAGLYGALSSRTALINVGMIVAGILAFGFSAPIWLAIGVVLCYFSFAVWTAAQLFRSGVLTPVLNVPILRLKPVLARFWRLIAPLLAVPLLAQVNIIVERIVASWIGSDAIAGVDYARFISDTLIVLSAVPLSMAILTNPNQSDLETIRSNALRVSRFLVAVMVPAATFLFVGAQEIVTVLYGRGAFNQTSIHVTSAILSGTALGLPFSATAYFLLKSLNSALLNRIAAALTLASALANAAVNLLLWRHFGALTLGLGASVGGVVVFVAASFQLKIMHRLGPLVLETAVTSACIATAGWLLLGHAHGLLRLVLLALVSAVAWTLLFAISAGFRSGLDPVLSRAVAAWKRLSVA